jgi:hypothetical protein
MTNLLQEDVLCPHEQRAGGWLNKLVISTGEVMGLRPTQADEKRLGPATTFYGTNALSFVIPSNRLAEASRERNDKACVLCNIEG